MEKVFDIVKAADVNTVFSSVAELDVSLDAMQKQVVGGAYLTKSLSWSMI